MAASTLSIRHFEGGDALPAFRARALLERLQQVCPRISAMAARSVHWAAFDREPSPDEVARVAALLDDGDAGAGDLSGDLIVVMPRLGTASPWASKATDIAHNCGLALHRLERVIEYRLNTGGSPLATADRDACAALLHDRMTETVAFARDAATHLFDPLSPPPLAHVPLRAQGRVAL
jgi:phosphoribosylformylglycinamidine synthase